MLTVAEMRAQVEALLRECAEAEGGNYEEFIADINRAFDARFEIIEETNP
jgi:hypothetical protein